MYLDKDFELQTNKQVASANSKCRDSRDLAGCTFQLLKRDSKSERIDTKEQRTPSVNATMNMHTHIYMYTLYFCIILIHMLLDVIQVD